MKYAFLMLLLCVSCQPSITRDKAESIAIWEEGQMEKATKRDFIQQYGYMAGEIKFMEWVQNTRNTRSDRLWIDNRTKEILDESRYKTIVPPPEMEREMDALNREIAAKRANGDYNK